MCEPVTAIAMAATLVSGAMSAYGQYQQGKAANAAGKYQQKVADNNAKLAERSAQDALQRGAIEESQNRLRTRLLVGSQRATYASRGIDLASESVADVVGGTEEVGELDALTTKSNAEREAQGFRIEGMNYTSQGQMARYEGQNAQRAGTIAGIGTLIGTAGSVAGKWYDMGKPNPFASKKTYSTGSNGKLTGGWDY